MDKKPTGVVGIYNSAGDLLEATAQVRSICEEEQLGSLNAHTPYPVHGLSQALGLPRSPLGYFVLGGGLCGIAVALALQGLTSAVDYPLILSGKPHFAWPAYIPIVFELMVLIAAFTAFFGMLGVLNRLPYFGHPLLGSKAIALITRDRFGLIIEAHKDQELDYAAAQQLLEKSGAQAIELLFPPNGMRAHKTGAVPFLQFGVIAAIVFTATFSGWCTYWVMKLWPDMPPNIYMHVQNKLKPYSKESFFLDQKGMRTPPDSTIAREHLPYPFQIGVHDVLAGEVLGNPLPLTKAVLDKGRERFEVYCMVCHGALGDGQKLLTAEYLASPANLHSARVRKMPDGQIFHAITVGKGAMSGYQSQLEPDDRWAIIHYLRALQRSQNATDQDIDQALASYNVVQAESEETAEEIEVRK
ncbi:DUF3341 domain-containing protein [Oligoflexia bacterium]|nr:DUF3341 domain-containing protein [Oligoflexia bacterium]